MYVADYDIVMNLKGFLNRTFLLTEDLSGLQGDPFSNWHTSTRRRKLVDSKANKENQSLKKT